MREERFTCNIKDGFYYLGGIPFYILALGLRCLCSRADVGVSASCSGREGSEPDLIFQLPRSLYIIVVPWYPQGIGSRTPRGTKISPNFYLGWKLPWTRGINLGCARMYGHHGYRSPCISEDGNYRLSVFVFPTHSNDWHVVGA